MSTEVVKNGPSQTANHVLEKAKDKVLIDFVGFIVNPLRGANRKNVTNLSKSVKSILRQAKCVDKKGKVVTTLQKTKDNLERIKKFRDVFSNQLKGALDGTLLKPLESPEGGESRLDLLRKNERISELLREEGNKFYKKKDLRRATRCYGLAVMFAPKGSKAEALAYSNRSASFYENKDYKNCLRDIQKFEAIWTDSDDPNVADRLAKRKGQSRTHLQDTEEDASKSIEVKFASEFLKLEKPNDSVPAAESFIGIQEDATGERGRYVANIGDAAIPPGKVLIIEEPYAHVLLDSYWFNTNHCSSCLADLNGGGIPCEGCVFVMYCSGKCAKSTNHRLHSKYECKIAPYLYELNMNRTIYLSLQILLKLTPTGFFEFLSSLSSSKSEAKQIAGFSEKGIYDSSSYSPLYHLIYHDEILSEADVLTYCNDAVLVTEILHAETDYFSSLELDPAEEMRLRDEFAKCLLLHQMNLPCNAHSLYKMENADHSIDEVGAGAFPLLSMINHSCDPNVVRLTLRNAVNVVISIQHIAPGEELVDNYGAHYAMERLKERKSHLKSMYNFDCKCPACSKDWPIISEMDEANCHNICPQCRLSIKSGECDRFKDAILAVHPTDQGQYQCLNCEWEQSKGEWTKALENNLDTYESAKEKLSKNLLSESFSDAVSSLEYYDSHFLKPFKLINCSQEIAKQALFLLTKTTFE